jgi:hypothetical protein
LIVKLVEFAHLVCVLNLPFFAVVVAVEAVAFVVAAAVALPQNFEKKGSRLLPPR